MRKEERGCNMITDKQGIEWLLKKLYDDGWRYIALDKYGNMCLTDKKIYENDDICKATGYKKHITESWFKSMLPKLKPNEVFSIEEELGIVDWSKVAVDTPILVKQHEQDKWEKRHFAYFKDGRVCAWLCGATSWSADYGDDITNWNFAKLAEV